MTTADQPTFTLPADFHATLSRWLVISTPNILLILVILYAIATEGSRSTTTAYLAGAAIALLLLLSISIFKTISTTLSVTQSEITYKVFIKKIVIARVDISTIYARSKFAQHFFIRLKNDQMIKIPLALFSTIDCVALFETLNVPVDQRPAYSVRGWRGWRLMR